MRSVGAVTCLAVVLVGCGSNPAGMSIFPDYKATFAALGDYGVDTGNENHVARLIGRWHPDFIITLGDNNYDDGGADTIDENVGKYFAEYIGGYAGKYGEGSRDNRFWPSVGNHDWTPGDHSIQPYVDYFDALPGNKRYYDFVANGVHFFSIDSDHHEPDGVDVDSKQALWLKNALAQATECFKVVYFHHPPYSSGDPRFNSHHLDWPFKQWGVDVVLNGHQHFYERLVNDGLPYVIAGLGGGENVFAFSDPHPGSLVRYNSDFGALLVSVSDNELAFEFRNVHDHLVDQFTIDKACN